MSAHREAMATQRELELNRREQLLEKRFEELAQQENLIQQLLHRVSKQFPFMSMDRKASERSEAEANPNGFTSVRSIRLRMYTYFRSHENRSRSCWSA